jgi:hypothetical protein
MTQHDTTGFLLRYWPLLLGTSTLLIGVLAGMLLGRLGRGYDDGWKAGYQAHKEQRQEIRNRLRDAQRDPSGAAETRVMPHINPPRPTQADQTLILRNLRRNP